MSLDPPSQTKEGREAQGEGRGAEEKEEERSEISPMLAQMGEANFPQSLPDCTPQLSKPGTPLRPPAAPIYEPGVTGASDLGCSQAEAGVAGACLGSEANPPQPLPTGQETPPTPTAEIKTNLLQDRYGTHVDIDRERGDLNSNVHDPYLHDSRRPEPCEGENPFYLEDGEEADAEPWGKQSHREPYSMHEYDSFSHCTETGEGESDYSEGEESDSMNVLIILGM